MLAEQVVSEAAVGADRQRTRALLDRPCEILKRAGRLAFEHHRRPHSGLRSGAVGPHLLGAAEKAGGARRVAKVERRLAGGDQRGEVLGAFRQQLDVAGEHVLRALRRGPDRPRVGRRRIGRHRGSDTGENQRGNPHSANRPFAHRSAYGRKELAKTCLHSSRRGEPWHAVDKTARDGLDALTGCSGG